MFFIGIMGMNQTQKVVKTYDHFPCPGCKEEPEGKLVKVYSYFHLFFIPVFKWNEKYVVVCEQCQQGFEVTKEKGKAIERGEEALTYWDLKPLQPLQKRCPMCGEVLVESHNYCPKCGHPIK